MRMSSELSAVLVSFSRFKFERDFFVFPVTLNPLVLVIVSCTCEHALCMNCAFVLH